MAYNYPCDWRYGFINDPTKRQRIGYLTTFAGIGLSNALPADLSVSCPFVGNPAYTQAKIANGKINVVAVLENVSWGGGVGDAISFSGYISSERANQLRSLTQATLKTTSISQIGWWIANFDPESKAWFEEYYPVNPPCPSAQIHAVSQREIRLHVADEPVKVAPTIDTGVYNVYFEIVPTANQTATFAVATAPGKVVVKPWGLVLGTLAQPSATRS